MESILYSGTKSFTDLLPNGDKVSSEYFANPIKGGADYLIDPMSDADGNTTGFLIYENNGDKDLALRQQQGTVVTVEQAKAGNWNPATNKVDTNQTFTIQNDGNVTSTPVTATPSTGDGTGSTTPTTGTTGDASDTDSVVIDFDQVDQYVENIDKNFKKINNSLNHVVSCFNSIEKLMKGNGLDNQINNIVKTCKKRYDYNSKKAAKLRTDINSDIYVILNQLMKSVQELQAAASKTEKDVSANSI